MGKYQKGKDTKNAPGPGFRTPSFIKGKIYAGKKPTQPQIKFNPAQFKTQHKG